MLRDLAEEIYLQQDYNCAESLLRMCNSTYSLGIAEEDLQLVSGYGAGICSGKICGAVCAAVAALSRMAVTGRAHATPDFRELIGGFVSEAESKLGSLECDELVKIYKKDDVRCIETVKLVADLLEEYLQKNQLPKQG